MVLFFSASSNVYYAMKLGRTLLPNEIQRLSWLLGGGTFRGIKPIEGRFVGPRKELVSPWSTNAVEIAHNIGVTIVERIERFVTYSENEQAYDPMLQQVYPRLDQRVFGEAAVPEPICTIADIDAYNRQEGLALSKEEIAYLEEVSNVQGRPLTDSEIFGFAQVNSEHCRHKTFNAVFTLDGRQKTKSLFQLIRDTSERHPNRIVSAYSDNVAFIKGPTVIQFAPESATQPSYFAVREIQSVISLKAETHNFPVTVEPFNGAATGSGGEIRDRLAGGKGSLPLAGTAVYMTSYPRLGGERSWEKKWKERPWAYRKPAHILIHASDGASDFGNKFGQPLICGSLLAFEHFEKDKRYGFDKAIMLAGGIGFSHAEDSQKDIPGAGEKIVMMGGDNYRIGMGGGAVSSLAAGTVGSELEWKAIQRANPEMQKRVMNVIRALVEMKKNPIRSIHDHGAGGHFNCFAELLEATGGSIDIDKLPKGDASLSYKELLSNESQERMGLVVARQDVPLLRQIAERERAPLYVVGTVGDDKRLRFVDRAKNIMPIDLIVKQLFGFSQRASLGDRAQPASFAPLRYDVDAWPSYLKEVLQLESVACKDWLTNKVDRSVTGLVALQQTCGAIQLPLNNVGVMALDALSGKGVATALGHAAAAALISAAAGSRLAIARALTNLIWAPLTHGLKGVSLSANWMWPAHRPGENARLYEGVEAASRFAQALKINIPTGKDSLSMEQKYPHEPPVKAPGTVIVSAVAEVENIRHTVSPCLAHVPGSSVLYIPFSRAAFELGGSSLAQVLNRLGEKTPDPLPEEAPYFAGAFRALQELIRQQTVVAGHDIAAGGLIVTLLEMCFPSPEVGLDIDIRKMGRDTVKVLFSEKPGVVIQVEHTKSALALLRQHGVDSILLGEVIAKRELRLRSASSEATSLPIDTYRDAWFRTSFLLDKLQRPRTHAIKRKENYPLQPLTYTFPDAFDGALSAYRTDQKDGTKKIKAAIIREKGVNGDRELAYAFYLAGFSVKDVHMTDLVAGRENLSDIHLIAFAGGFSHSDVFSSAKGWAGTFLYNPKAKAALNSFYARKDTLSIGICNGCQLMIELGLLYPDKDNHPTIHKNLSGKFESLFANLTIPPGNAVMFSTLTGSRLGAWSAHAEGRFKLPEGKENYHIAATYAYDQYPGNPNDSDFAAAALASTDGRHLAIMPHIERSLFPWNWPHYPRHRKAEEISPWIEAFVNARRWLQQRHSD